jgi:phage virion morphogenesis protein
VALMAGASFSMPMDGLMRAVDAGISHAQRTQQLAEAIGEALVSSTQQRFEDQERPDGSKWEPSLRAKNEGGVTLTDKGTLKKSIGYAASPAKVTVGTSMKYAAIHQRGGTIRGKKGKLKFPLPGGGFAQVDQVAVPERSYLGLSEEDVKEVREMMVQHMRQALLGG